eukprot:7720328-Pyramimonas_sp.AAC.1
MAADRSRSGRPLAKALTMPWHLPPRRPRCASTKGVGLSMWYLRLSLLSSRSMSAPARCRPASPG